MIAGATIQLWLIYVGLFLVFLQKYGTGDTCDGRLRLGTGRCDDSVAAVKKVTAYDGGHYLAHD